MVNLIGFVIDAAQQIVAAVIAQGASEWWARRRMSRQALEQMAADAVTVGIVKNRDIHLSNREFEELVRRVLDEVRRLAREHPDLEWRTATLRPLRPLPPIPRQMPDREHQEKLLEERLERLEWIVAMRRLQVGLAVNDQIKASLPPRPRSLPGPNQDAMPSAATVEAADEITIETVPLPPEGEDWQARIRYAQGRVKRDRAAGVPRRQDG